MLPAVDISPHPVHHPSRSPHIPIPIRNREGCTDLQPLFGPSPLEEEEKKINNMWFDYCDYLVYSRIVDHLLEQRNHIRDNYALSVNTKCLYHTLRARQNDFRDSKQPDVSGLISLNDATAVNDLTPCVETKRQFDSFDSLSDAIGTAVGAASNSHGTHDESRTANVGGLGNSGTGTDSDSGENEDFSSSATSTSSLEDSFIFELDL
jgi:hypothetical protein